MPALLWLERCVACKCDIYDTGQRHVVLAADAGHMGVGVVCCAHHRTTTHHHSQPFTITHTHPSLVAVPCIRSIHPGTACMIRRHSYSHNTRPSRLTARACNPSLITACRGVIGTSMKLWDLHVPHDAPDEKEL